MKKIIIYMLFIVFLFIALTKTNSKFITTINVKKNMEIAKPIFIVEKDEKIYITNENVNNVVNEYNFCIKNYSNSNISDVNFEYIIEIDNQIDLSLLDYKLYKVDNGKEKIISIENNKSPKFKIYCNETKEQQYKIKFTIPEDLNEKEIKDEFNIKIIALQLL